MAQVESATVRALLRLNRALTERTEQLENALQSRVVIEQAKGVLAARHGLEITEAFEVLRRGARSHRMRVHDLAVRVVDEHETPAEITPFL